jgi:hypothetical protein
MQKSDSHTSQFQENEEQAEQTPATDIGENKDKA